MTTGTTHRKDGTRLAACACTGSAGRSVQDRTSDDTGSATWTCRCCGASTHRRTPTTAKRLRMKALMAELLADASATKQEDTMTAKNTSPTCAQLIAAEDSGYLTFDDGILTMHAHGNIRVPVQSSDHLEHLMDLLGGGCMCSSSIDFPDDETDDPNALAICYKLRGRVDRS